MPLFELPIENNKYPNFEWREGGRDLDSFVLKLPYLKMKGDFDWSCKDINYGKYQAFPLFSSSPKAFIFFFQISSSLTPNIYDQYLGPNSLRYVKLIAYLP